MLFKSRFSCILHDIRKFSDVRAAYFFFVAVVLYVLISVLSLVF